MLKLSHQLTEACKVVVVYIFILFQSLNYNIYVVLPNKIVQYFVLLLLYSFDIQLRNVSG